ncbi:MAG: TonB-dependent receptor [Dissulfuribacterales bacterium]
MFKPITVSFVGIFAACTSTIAFALSEATQQLGEITVTAERFPTEVQQSARMISVISSEELQETGADNLVTALQRTGAFTYKAFGPLGISHGGMNSSLSMRGIQNGELVLINGVPIQSSASHAYDLDVIPIDQIERVEILKGAASTLYGSNAMSGVINIITKRPIDTREARAKVEFGNRDYNNHSISLTAFRTTLGINFQHLNDIDEISRSYTKKYRYDLGETNKVAWNINSAITDNLFFDYLGSTYTTDFIKRYDNPKIPYEGVDQNSYKHFTDLRYETTNTRAKIFGNFEEMQRDEYTNPKSTLQKNKIDNYGFEYDYRFNLFDYNLTTGIDWITREANYNLQYGKHHRHDYAAFMQIKRELWDRLTVTIGGREQIIDGEAGTKNYDTFLPSLGLFYKLTDNLSIFTNTGRAFRAPTYNQLYYSSSFLVGNPNLTPEKGWTYELGFKEKNKYLNASIALFSMNYTDKIEIDRSKSYPQTYYNAGDYESKGIEWDFAITPFVFSKSALQNVSFTWVGYWADPKADDSSGKRVQIGAKFSSAVGIAYLTDDFTVNLNCQMLASRERNLDDYAIFNIYSRYRLPKGYLTFAIDNIFNEDQIIAGDLTPNAINRYFYQEMGRLFKIGYEIKF